MRIVLTDYKFTYEYRIIPAPANIQESWLNELGKEGFHLSAIMGGQILFSRVIRTEATQLDA